MIREFLVVRQLITGQRWTSVSASLSSFTVEAQVAADAVSNLVRWMRGRILGPIANRGETAMATIETADGTYRLLAMPRRDSHASAPAA